MLLGAQTGGVFAGMVGPQPVRAAMNAWPPPLTCRLTWICLASQPGAQQPGMALN